MRAGGRDTSTNGHNSCASSVPRREGYLARITPSAGQRVLTFRNRLRKEGRGGRKRGEGEGGEGGEENKPIKGLSGPSRDHAPPPIPLFQSAHARSLSWKTTGSRGLNTRTGVG